MEVVIGLLIYIIFVYAAYFVIGILNLIGMFNVTKNLGLRWFYFITPMPVLNIARKHNFYKFLFLGVATIFASVLLSAMFISIGSETYNGALTGIGVLFILLLVVFGFGFNIMLYIKLYNAYELNGQPLNIVAYIINTFLGLNFFYLRNKQLKTPINEITSKQYTFDKVFSLLPYGLIILNIILAMVFSDF